MTYRRIRDGMLCALAVACGIVVIIAQVYISINPARTTEDAVLFTSKNSLSFTGIIVRDETVVYSPFTSNTGVLSYTVSDGDRLSKSSSIANIYDNEDQIYFRHRIEELERKIKLLEQAQSHGTTEYAQPEFLSAQIVEGYKEILDNMAQGDYSSVYSDSDNLLKMMSIFNITTNFEVDFNVRIEALKQELSICKASLKNPIGTITSSDAGYFTSSFDGYENELTIDSIGKLSVDDVKSIIKNPINKNAKTDNAIGKVFHNYSWKMVGIIDTDHRYFVNQKMSFVFTGSNNRHDVVVEAIYPTGNGNEAIIVLSCNELDEEIASSRVQDVELIFSEHTGLRIPREAIRFIDGVKGVYVTVGESTEFKMLDVIYEGDDFVLSKNTSKNDYVNLYDRIILDHIEALQ